MEDLEKGGTTRETNLHVWKEVCITHIDIKSMEYDSRAEQPVLRVYYKSNRSPSIYPLDEITYFSVEL